MPYTGAQISKLVNLKALDILNHGEHLHNALSEANRLYRPSGMPVIFDLQLEAELFSCALFWRNDAPPEVLSHPLERIVSEISYSVMPCPEHGRYKIVLDAIRRAKASIGDETALYGVICGPLTMAAHIRGTEIFTDLTANQDLAKALINYCAECIRVIADMYISEGIDVVTVADPLATQISPELFEYFLREAYTSVFSHIRDKNTFSVLLTCGDVMPYLSAMCMTAPDCVSVGEEVSLAEAKTVTDKYNIAVSGNIPVYTLLQNGTPEDCARYALDLVEGIEDKRNLIISTGYDIPFGVPPENIAAVGGALRDLGTAAQVPGGESKPQAPEEDVKLPDYKTLPKPLLEVFTFDSASCAISSYICKTVKNLAASLNNGFDFKEYKLSEKETASRRKKMGGAPIPSIYINGKLIFSSTIPSAPELKKAAEAYL